MTWQRTSERGSPVTEQQLPPSSLPPAPYKSAAPGEPRASAACLLARGGIRERRQSPGRAPPPSLSPFLPPSLPPRRAPLAACAAAQPRAGAAMGLTISSLFSRLFGKKQMRILMGKGRQRRAAAVPPEPCRRSRCALPGRGRRQARPLPHGRVPLAVGEGRRAAGGRGLGAGGGACPVPGRGGDAGHPSVPFP